MTETLYNIAVIGIGAMGGGISRALMESNLSRSVAGFDQATPLVEAFYQESQACGKAIAKKPRGLRDAVANVDFVLIVLQSESQCEQVCFGSNDGDDTTNLLSLLQPDCCVILSSTVTAAWVQKAAKRFQEKGILFVDSPVSGGPARARSGELTIMSSGDDTSLARAQPLLEALGSAVHIIPGGPGMGSTVKMVHQLLAGVHICVAAEAMALAAKAGIAVEQLYEIVNGAAGASWMFQDRGPRMMTMTGSDQEAAEIKSQLQIFVKDLDIVHAEAKRLQAPVPLASAALQQFISGQSLGLSKQDDSQVVQVYEKITGVKVQKQLHDGNGCKREGDNVGDYWQMQDGTWEEILEVGNEPRHKVVLSNEYIRALRVCFPPQDTTLAHRHAEDSLYFFLVPGGMDAINHVKGNAPACDCMGFGEVRYGAHKTEKPLVHKISNRSDKTMLCIDAEILKQPPVTSAIALMAEKHELIKTRDKVRVYKLTLEPGESITTGYPFFHCSVIVEPSLIEKQVGGGRITSKVQWIESSELGDVAWKEPILEITKRNVGESTFVEYITEWC